MKNAIVKLTVVGCWLSISAAWVAAEDANDEELKKIEAATVDLGRPVDFEQDVYPILDANCIACHNLAISEGKLNLEEVEGILKGGKRGAGVVPKEPDKSLLYLVASRAQQPVMPPLPNQVEADPLTPKELGILRQWILEGASGGAGSARQAVQWHPLPSELNAIYSLAMSESGRFVASSRANRISVYDIVTGQEAAQLTDPALLDIEYDGKPMYGPGTAHRDFVHSLAFSPDGSLLASGGFRVVKLWQRPENAQRVKTALNGSVSAVAVSADGQWAALGTADHAVQLWNLSNGELVRNFAGHTETITGLQFSEDGERLASSSLDKTIRVWNVADGAALGDWETPAAINGIALNKEATQVISADADNQLRVWAMPGTPEWEQATAKPEEDAENENEEEEAGIQPLLEIKGHGQPVTSVALVLPDGNQIVSGSEDGTVRIWQLANGQQVRAMNHGGPVTAVAVRPDGQMVASAGANNIAKLWQFNNGQQRAELKGNLELDRAVIARTDDQTVAQQQMAQAEAAFKAAEQNLNDREEASTKAQEAKEAADKEVTEAEAKAKEANEKLEAAKKEAADNPDNDDLKKKVSEAEEAAAKEADALKKAQDAQTAAQRTLELAQKAVETAKEQLDDRKKLEEAAKQRHEQAGEQLTAAQQTANEAGAPLRAIAFSTDGKTLATAGDDRLIQLWDAENGAPLEQFSGHESPVLALSFAAGDLLLSGSEDKQAIAWETNPEWTLVGQLGASADDPLDISESPFENRILALDFSPNGQWLATGGGEPSRSGELMIWDVEKRELVREFIDAHSDTVFGLEFSRDGTFLLSGSADKFVKIFNTESGEHVRSFEGHTHHVMDVSWKADGSVIASAGADNAIKVWNVETGEQQRTITNYSKQVTAIQFVGVSENVVSCGGDATVRYHRTSNGQNYRNFGGASDFMYTVATTRDEEVVVAGGEDGVLRIWNGKNGQSLLTFEPPQPTPDESQASAAASVGEN